MSSIGSICPKEPTNNGLKVFLNLFLNTQKHQIDISQTFNHNRMKFRGGYQNSNATNSKNFQPHFATTPVPSIRLACQTCNVDIITFEWHVISSHKEIQGVSGPDKGWITLLSSYCGMTILKPRPHFRISPKFEFQDGHQTK